MTYKVLSGSISLYTLTLQVFVNFCFDYKFVSVVNMLGTKLLENGKQFLFGPLLQSICIVMYKLYKVWIRHRLMDEVSKLSNFDN